MGLDSLAFTGSGVANRRLQPHLAGSFAIADLSTRRLARGLSGYEVDSSMGRGEKGEGGSVGMDGRCGWDMGKVDGAHIAGRQAQPQSPPRHPSISHLANAERPLFSLLLLQMGNLSPYNAIERGRCTVTCTHESKKPTSRPGCRSARGVRTSQTRTPSPWHEGWARSQ